MANARPHREDDGFVGEFLCGGAATDAAAVFLAGMFGDGPGLFGRTGGIPLEEPGLEFLNIHTVQHLSPTAVFHDHGGQGEHPTGTEWLEKNKR